MVINDAAVYAVAAKGYAADNFDAVDAVDAKA